jgi:hypothetical protein
MIITHLLYGSDIFATFIYLIEWCFFNFLMHFWPAILKLTFAPQKVKLINLIFPSLYFDFLRSALSFEVNVALIQFLAKLTPVTLIPHLASL